MTADPALLAEQLGAVNETTDSVDYAGDASGESAAGAAAGPASGPNYNVAPTSTVTTVVRRHAAPDDEPTRRIRLMRWGLVPPWTKPGSDGGPAAGGPLLINARADKVTTSPAYRSSVAHRRCLVPMDGFYEWRADGNGAGAGRGRGRKTPFYISRTDGATLFAAGLWSVWRDKRHPQGRPLLSCTIITTDAVGELADVHDRMPLLLQPADFDDWLDPDTPADPALLSRPPDIADIALREVSTLVNRVANNGPELISPVSNDHEGQMLF